MNVRMKLVPVSERKPGTPYLCVCVQDAGSGVMLAVTAELQYRNPYTEGNPAWERVELET